MKGDFFVLRRVRGGDVDLIATLYGTSGKVNLFVREGLLNENRFFGDFELFNLVSLDATQSGNMLIPNDVMRVRRFSLLARDYARFVFMSNTAKAVLSFVSFYDEEVFGLILRAFSSRVRNAEASSLRFYLELMRVLGYSPKFLSSVPKRGGFVNISLEKGDVSEEGEYRIRAELLGILRRISGGDYERVRVSRKAFLELERFLFTFLRYHTTR
ncbi:MAG: hypothetical protein GXO04_05645 [Aquificae bacterium]|nr:hypothetical protein [Aquificota bacterium]